MVVGGGDSAMEEANFLTRFGSEVALVHRRDTFRASKIMLDRAKANPKIKFIMNTVVEDVFDVNEELVTGVRLRNLVTGEVWEQDVDGFFVAIGHIPEHQDLSAARSILDPDGYISPTAARAPTSPAFFMPAMCRTASTARPLPQPAPAAWRPSKPSACSKRKDTNR